MSSFYSKAKEDQLAQKGICRTWGCRTTFILAITATLFSALFIAIAYFINTVKTGAVSPDRSMIDKIQSDWTTKPFVDILVQRTPCTEPKDAFFFRDWRGTVEGCVVDEKTVISKEKYESEEYRQEKGASRPSCTPIEALEPERQTEFIGSHFCGVRGGLPFSEVTRPELSTEKCPAGTVACSEETSVENTVCYPEAELKTSCPILDVSFQRTESLEETTLYEYRVIKSTIMLVITKKAANNLPLMETRIEFQPCAKLSQLSADPDSQVIAYPLEVDQPVTECSVDEATSLATDERFAVETLDDSEYDVQKASGVLSKLQKLPLYEELVGSDYIQGKIDNKYHFFSKPTITWSLACDEASSTSRAAMITLFNQEQGGRAAEWSLIDQTLVSCLAIAAFSLLCVFGLLSSFCCQKKSVQFLYFLPFTIWCLLSLGGMGYFSYLTYLTTQASTEQTNLIKSYSAVNDCSDEYTKFDFEKATNKLEGPTLYFTMLAGFISIGLLAVFSLIVCIYTCKKMNDIKKQPGSSSPTEYHNAPESTSRNASVLKGQKEDADSFRQSTPQRQRESFASVQSENKVKKNESPDDEERNNEEVHSVRSEDKVVHNEEGSEPVLKLDQESPEQTPRQSQPEQLPEKAIESHRDVQMEQMSEPDDVPEETPNDVSVPIVAETPQKSDISQLIDGKGQPTPSTGAPFQPNNSSTQNEQSRASKQQEVIKSFDPVVEDQNNSSQISKLNQVVPVTQAPPPPAEQENPEHGFLPDIHQGKKKKKSVGGARPLAADDDDVADFKFNEVLVEDEEADFGKAVGGKPPKMSQAMLLALGNVGDENKEDSVAKQTLEPGVRNVIGGESGIENMYKAKENDIDDGLNAEFGDEDDFPRRNR